MHSARGWPVAVVSGAVTTHFPIGAGIVANLAALHRRFGLVAVTRAGSVLAAAGLGPGRLARAILPRGPLQRRGLGAGKQGRAERDSPW